MTGTLPNWGGQEPQGKQGNYILKEAEDTDDYMEASARGSGNWILKQRKDVSGEKKKKKLEKF